MVSLFLHNTTQRLLSWGKNSPWKILGMWHIQTDFTLKGRNKVNIGQKHVSMGFDGRRDIHPFSLYEAILYSHSIWRTDYHDSPECITSILRQPLKYDCIPTSDEYPSRSQVFSYFVFYNVSSDYTVIYFLCSMFKKIQKDQQENKNYLQL